MKTEEEVHEWFDTKNNNCICTRLCDCESPENGRMSNECPIHNDIPQPDTDCLAKRHWYEMI